MLSVTRGCVFLLQLLWRAVRWSGRVVYQGASALYHRRQARMQGAQAHPRTVYTGRWQLSADTRFCGRAVVLCHQDTFRPGVELIAFGEEAAELYHSERQCTDEEEAVMVAEQMLLRFPGCRHRRQGRTVPATAVLVTEPPANLPVNDEAA